MAAPVPGRVKVRVVVLVTTPETAPWFGATIVPLTLVIVRKALAVSVKVVTSVNVLELSPEAKDIVPVSVCNSVAIRY